MLLVIVEVKVQVPLPAGLIEHVVVPIVSPVGLDTKLKLVSVEANPDAVMLTVIPLGPVEGVIVSFGMR